MAKLQSVAELENLRAQLLAAPDRPVVRVSGYSSSGASAGSLKVTGVKCPTPRANLSLCR